MFFPFYILVLLVTCVEAQDNPLTLDELLVGVKERFPLVAGAKQDKVAAEGEVRSAEGAFDVGWKTKLGVDRFGYYENQQLDSFLEQPTTLWGTRFLAGYRLGTGSFAAYDGKLATNPFGEIRAGFQVPLWRDGPIDRNRASLSRAKLGVSIADTQVTQQRIDAVRTATHRFWDWVGAAKKVVIYKELLNTAEVRDKGLEQRVKLGDLPDFERRDNERAILQRRSQLVAAVRGLENASIELSIYLRDQSGEPVLSAAERAPEIPEPNRENEPHIDFEIAFKNRPDFGRLALVSEQVEIDRQLAENQQMPKIDVELLAVQNLRDGDPARNGTRLAAGVMVEIPLQTNVAGGRGEAARATNQRVELQRKLLRDRIVAEVRDSHSALNAAFQRVDLTRKETELARLMEKGERERFTHGDSNQLFVNLREQASADAAVREVEALTDYHKSLATLRAALGLD